MATPPSNGSGGAPTPTTDGAAAAAMPVSRPRAPLPPIQLPTFFGYRNPTDEALILQWGVGSFGTVLISEGFLRWTKAGQKPAMQKALPPKMRFWLYTTGCTAGWFMNKYCLPPPPRIPHFDEKHAAEKVTAEAAAAIANGTSK